MSVKEYESNLEQRQAAFNQIADHIHAQQRKGSGTRPTEYQIADFGEWQTLGLEPNNNDHIDRMNNEAVYVLEQCSQIANEIMGDDERVNGPNDNEKLSIAHGYRCACIVINEFGIKDPVVVATAFLNGCAEHLYKQLRGKHEYFPKSETFDQEVKQFLESILQRYFTWPMNEYSAENFRAKLLANLNHFYEANQERTAFQDQLVARYRQPLETVVQTGFISPDEYQQFRKTVIKDMMKNDDGQGQMLPDLLQMFKFAADLLNGHTAIGTQHSSGLAVQVAMMAKVIDEHRYPQYDTSSMNSNHPQHGETRVRQMIEGMLTSLTYLPLSRALHLQSAVASLSEVIAQAYFPEEWLAYHAATDEMATGYQRTGEYKNRDQRKNSFEVQLRMSEIALRQFIDRSLDKAGLVNKVSYVSHNELEHRKYLKTISQWPGPIMSDWEYTLFSDVKTPASTFSKWLADATGGKLSHYGEVGSRDFNTQFRDPETWKNYLVGATDGLRSTVILGQKLAEYFALPESHSDYSQTVIGQTQFRYLDDRPETLERLQAVPLNNFVPNRTEDFSYREAAEKLRVSPKFDTETGELFYEVHVILLLLQKSLNAPEVANLPFEIKVETAKQWERNNFGSDAHFIYKLKEFLPKTSSSEQGDQKKELLALYMYIQSLMYQLVFDGTLY